MISQVIGGGIGPFQVEGRGRPDYTGTMGSAEKFDDYRTGAPSPGQEHQLYLKILGDFPALIWRAGTDSLCDWFNTTWLEFTGRSMEQEAGNGWAEGVHPEDIERCVKYYLDHFERRQPFRMEYRLRHHSGEYRWILDIGRPFFDLENRFLGYIGSCYDVTEEHRMVAQLTDLGDFRDRLFSIIGHDLKNQVGSTLGLAEFLESSLSGGDPNEIREFTNDIIFTSRKSLELLNDLMEWAGARLGLVRVKLQAVDLTSLVRETLDLFTVQATAKGIDLVAGTPAGAVLKTDPDILRTLLRNLAGNAIKFTPHGGRITVGFQAEKGRVVLSVTDTGLGMDSEQLEKIRNARGQTGSRPGTDNEPGTGLGLMLCRELLALLGGSLEVESSRGAGSCFSLILPELA